MTAAMRDARSSALQSSASAALDAAAPASLCQRLRDDPVSLIPGTSQLPAFRLIYRLPQLHAEKGYVVAARVFATWLFGDLSTQSHPYRLPQGAGDFGTAFGYRAFQVPWRVVADSPTLRIALSGIQATLETAITAQIDRRLTGDPAAGPRAIDRYAAKVWGDLRKRFLAARAAGKPARIATDWLPLPSAPVHFYADVLKEKTAADGELKPSEAAMVFGGANVYPIIQGHIEGTGSPDGWVLKVDQWRPVVVDRFSFEDDHSAPLQFIYGLTMGALRSKPGVLEYPGATVSQPLGLWDPQGHLRMRGGSAERPVIELLNRSFTDFARQVAVPLADLRRRIQCRLVSEMQCAPVDLISLGPAQTLPEVPYKIRASSG